MAPIRGELHKTREMGARLRELPGAMRARAVSAVRSLRRVRDSADATRVPHDKVVRPEDKQALALRNRVVWEPGQALGRTSSSQEPLHSDLISFGILATSPLLMKSQKAREVAATASLL